MEVDEEGQEHIDKKKRERRRREHEKGKWNITEHKERNRNE